MLGRHLLSPLAAYVAEKGKSGFSILESLICWANNPLLWAGMVLCTVCRKFKQHSWPLSTQCQQHSSPVVITKNVSKHYQMFLGGAGTHHPLENTRSSEHKERGMTHGVGRGGRSIQIPLTLRPIIGIFLMSLKNFFLNLDHKPKRNKWFYYPWTQRASHSARTIQVCPLQPICPQVTKAEFLPI